MRVLKLLAAPITLIALAAVACAAPEQFEGTELTSANPAAPFQLENQFGNRVSLSDHKGQVVVLTFLYTSCPDICPLTTSHLRDTDRILGETADVEFMAVSVDPERDSVDAAHKYLEKWGKVDEWQFLVGDRAELSPVWRAYFIDPVADVDSEGDEDDEHDGDDGPSEGAGRLEQEIVDAYLVNHAAPVYLIDREGIMRVVFTLPFEPEAVAHDVRLLLD